MLWKGYISIEMGGCVFSSLYFCIVIPLFRGACVRTSARTCSDSRSTHAPANVCIAWTPSPRIERTHTQHWTHPLDPPSTTTSMTSNAVHLNGGESSWEHTYRTCMYCTLHGCTWHLQGTRIRLHVYMWHLQDTHVHEIRDVHTGRVPF